MGLAVETPYTATEPANALTTDGSYMQEPVFGGKLYYYETGPKQGKPIVLVHGLDEQGMSYWHDVVVELAQTYRVILLDLPGFGRSGRVTALYSPAQYAKLLNWFIRRRTNSPVTLIGHSMGGAIALYYAATYPKNLRHLIVFDAAGILHRTAFTKHFTDIYQQDDPLLGSLTRDPGSHLNTWMSILLTKAESMNKPFEIMLDNPQLSKYLLKGTSPLVIAGFALAQTDFSKIIGKIKTPTTIIWGREDKIAPPRVAQVLNRRIPHSRLIMIDDAGHTPMVTNIDVTNQILSEVLQTPQGQTSGLLYKSIRFKKRKRNGRCYKQDGMRFSGYYSKLRIIECSGVKLTDVTTPSLLISGSKVNIVRGYFTNRNTAITVRFSQLKMTNATVSGKVAIKATDSKLDLAGVDIDATQAGVATKNSATLICSLCEFNVPAIQGTVHGLYSLDRNNHL